MSSLQRDAKIYGAVESESYITFTGFCKKIYDATQQSVDVFIDDKKVETILANQKIADIENKYEVFDTNGFCFTYHLPKEYIGQKHKLEFKTQDGEQLLHSPTHTIDKFSPLYNQVMFIESLNQPIDEAKIKDMYCPNSIGFLATEENLKDELFMGYIKELMRRFPTMTIKGFCFRDNVTSKNIEIILAKSIYDVLGQIEFFIPVINDYSKFNGLLSVFKKCSNITQLFFNQKLFYLEQTIDEYDTQKDIFNFRQNKYLEEKEISLLDKNIAKIFLSKFLSFAEQSSSLIKENDSISEWIYFNIIKYSVGNSKAKAFLNNK